MAIAVATNFKRNLADFGYIEQNKNYFENFLTKLSELQANEFTCDVVIKIKDQQIHAHKIVLAGGSPYFSMCFFGELASVQRININEIKLDDLEFNAVSSIIEYFYTTRIKIDEENVKEIYRAADFLQVDWIRMKCFSYIKKIIDTNNCIDFWDFAESMCADQLSSDIILFILQNLTKLSSRIEFLSLSNQKMRKIISSESFINIKALYIAMIKWTKHIVDERRPVFNELIENIPFESLDKHFVTLYLAKEDLILSDYNSLKLCHSALLRRGNDKELISDNQDKVVTPHFFVLTSTDNESFVQYYNPYDIYIEKKPPPHDQIFPCAAIAAYQDKIFISGGLKNSEPIIDCIMYNTSSNQWTTTGRMKYNKFNHDMVVCDNTLYTCEYDFSLEKYDPQNNVWQAITYSKNSPSTIFNYMSADVLDCRIFALGGNRLRNVSILYSIDKRVGVWQHEINKNGICSILNFEETLYLSSTNLSFLEKYDVRNRKMIPASSQLLQPPGCGHTLTDFGGNIYLFDVNEGNAMEFDPLQNRWNYPKPLNGCFNYVRAAGTKIFGS